MPNRLINETSPYLLQHAHNPVDWYPWGAEPFLKAKEEDKPLLLSIGYSACHWCHVMEKECFENEAIAALTNEHFICIKVDREEHPDVDIVYMEAVQSMTGRGGWPLTVFLTPDGEPFFGGTYFPPKDGHGLPGFPRVLHTVADAYKTRRSQVAAAAAEVVSTVRAMSHSANVSQPLDRDILTEAFHSLCQQHDPDNGGFGSAPKFPHPMTLEFLLRRHHHTHDAQALSILQLSLNRMAGGGIYDQIGGGFHRYSTDACWLIPHFEKMLYDNALLSRLYLLAYQSMGNQEYRRVAEETIDYVLRDMKGPDGGFCSAQDADSEGEEGKYYVWTTNELEVSLGTEQGRLAASYFGATPQGNFDGKNVLHIPADRKAFAASAGIPVEECHNIIEGSKKKLLAIRQQRTAPGRDDKIIASWNGMMLRSLAEAASILGREDYRQEAISCADVLLHLLKRGDQLMHSSKDSITSVPGYLDDYALLIAALLAVHEASFEQRFLDEALSLAETMIMRFSDGGQKTLLFDTSADHSRLFVRPRDISDSVKPSGNSAAADMLLLLALITGDESYSKLAIRALESVRQHMGTQPLMLGNWLCALDFHLSSPTQIVVAGNYNDPNTQGLLRTLYNRYIPNKVLAGIQPGDAPASKARGIFQNKKTLGAKPAAYLCHGHTCYMPASDPQTLERQLATWPH